MEYSSTLLILEGKHSQFDELSKVIAKSRLHVHKVSKSEDALAYLALQKPELFFLDLTLDNRDAFDFLTELESKDLRGPATVVVFSERNEHYVEITALNSGADDYMVKPVNKRVLSSRINAWLRRKILSSGNPDMTRVKNDFSLDRERFALIIREEEVSLQRKEFEIISLLISRPRKVFSRNEIRESVWGSIGKGKHRSIDVHIRNLRSKIGSDYIKTYKGVGYSFDK